MNMFDDWQLESHMDYSKFVVELFVVKDIGPFVDMFVSFFLTI